ncbi:MAG: ATP-binding cassette domain-containing protein, partial [Burkholderiales bacterium]
MDHCAGGQPAGHRISVAGTGQAQGRVLAGVCIIKQLSVRALSHRFGHQQVLDTVSFDLAAGEAVALVGPSGCGKTTLLNLAAGLLQPWEGQITSHFVRPAMMF